VARLSWHDKASLVLVACAWGCPTSRPESLDVSIPSVASTATAIESPGTPPVFSIGPMRLIDTSKAPATSVACNEARVVWTDASGAVMTSRFGDGSPRQLSKGPAVMALALSGDDLFALLDSDPRFTVAQARGSVWVPIEEQVVTPTANIAADAESVVWVARTGSDDALFVLDRRSGRVESRSLGDVHERIARVVVDRRHAFVLADDSTHEPHLHDADLDGSGVRQVRAAGKLQDVGVADGVVVGLERAADPVITDLLVLGDRTRRVARFPAASHPTVVVGGGAACFLSDSDATDAATIGCVDLATGVTREADKLASHGKFLGICGGKRLVWTRPNQARDGWEVVYAEMRR